MKLTKKQELFAKEYMVDLNGTQAAIRAGYSKAGASVQASDNLANPNIAKVVQRNMDLRSARTEITADTVLTGIEDVIGRSLAKEEHGVALKGYELLGKHLKLFSDRVVHETEKPLEVSHSHKFKGLSDAELDTLIARTEKSVAAE